MKRVSLFLSDVQVEAFKALGKRLGRPQAELMRNALDAYVRQEGATVKPKAERPRARTRKRS